MKNPFRTRYRICTDIYCGYEVQYRWWWSPFYTSGATFRGKVNTFTSVEQAEQAIQNGRSTVVKYLD